MLAICGVCTVHAFGSELSYRNQSVCYPIPWNFLVVLRRLDMQFNEVAPLHIFSQLSFEVRLHRIGINSHERILK
jgi:hypothetical protein